MDKSKFLLLLDNGHGCNTPGKCSPDKVLREYAWARHMVNLIASKCRARGIKVELVCPELVDIPLRTRTSRVNQWCAKVGASNCLCLSIHLNAAGCDGKWHNARGFSGWVARNASSKSKLFAATIYKHAVAAGLKGNRAPQPGNYWVGNFAIVRDTNCPACLTENLFQDNREDVAYLMSDAGQDKIAEVHVDAIEEYIHLI